MTILELLKKILGIKHTVTPALQPGETLTAIIKDALSLNLEFVTGSPIEVSVTGIKPDTFEKAVGNTSSIYMTSTFGGNDIPCSQFILPSDTASMLLESMRAVHSDITTDEGSALNLLIDWIEGNLYYMFLPRQGEEGRHIRVKREYRAADLQALTWGVSDSVIFQVRTGGYTSYLAVPQEIWNGLCSGAGDKDFTWRLRSIVVTEYTGEGEGGSEPGLEPVSIDIARPGEFLLGRFFLPALLKDRDTVVSSAFKKISSGIDLPASGYFNVSLDVRADEGIYRLWYCFEGYTLNSFDGGLAPFDGLFKLILRDTVSSLKAACPGLKVSGIRYNPSPAPEPVKGSVVLHSEMKVNFKPVNTFIAVPSSFINLIAVNILSPWEMNLLQATYRNMILGVLSLNSSLFARGMGSFLNTFRGSDENLPAILSCLPFYEFMELVGDVDLKIIAQNFILPAFSSSYMRLFRIGVADHSAHEGAVCRLYTVNSDWQRINRYLPRGVVEDAEANMWWTGSEHFDEFNKKTMIDLYTASESGRLMLSPRVKFILKNQFFDSIQAGYGSELEKLKAAGEPFASLDGLPYNTRQLAITRVNDRDICLVMLWAGDRVQALTPLLSRARRRKIMEDSEVLRMQLSDGRITPGDIVRAIHSVQESLEKEKKRI